MGITKVELNGKSDFSCGNSSAAVLCGDKEGREKELFKKLNLKIDRLDKTASHHSFAQNTLYALSPLPPARRICSLPDSLDDKNYARAGLLVGMAAANFPGDLREMGLAFREGKNIFKEGLSGINYQGQHESRFFKGTFLEDITEKSNWLKKNDKTLYNSNFGKFVRSKCNINIDLNSITSIEGTSLSKVKFTGNYAQKLLGRSLYRIPVLGLFASAALEVPAVIRSYTKTKGSVPDKSKALGKQVIKSAGYVGIVNATIALAGAALIPYGYIAALVGMGIGSSVGLVISKSFNKKVDEVIS